MAGAVYDFEQVLQIFARWLLTQERPEENRELRQHLFGDLG